MRINWFRHASPATYYPLGGKMIPWFMALAAVFTFYGLYLGFFEAPDRLGGTNPQKEYYRIIFIHVPTAWMSMWLYVVMAGWAAIGLIFNTRLSFMMTAAAAPTGAMFTFLALLTGSFWGRPSWGTWWDWDPRLTTELILFFMYIGYIALRSAIDDVRRADRASSLLVIVGLFMVPVIFWSINCPDPNQCAALHQRSSMSQMDPTIFWAMMSVTFGFWMYSFGTSIMRVRTIILDRDKETEWVRRALEREQS